MAEAERLLTAELEDRAARHGGERVRLDTHETLEAATRIYRDSGYAEVPAFNDEPHTHHWFEKRLTRVARWARSQGVPARGALLPRTTSRCGIVRSDAGTSLRGL